MPCNSESSSSTTVDPDDSSSSQSAGGDTSSSSSSESGGGGDTSSSSSTTASSSSGDERTPAPPPGGCQPDDKCECECGCDDCGEGVPPCPDDTSEEPIRYFNGEIRLSVTDLSGAGFGLPWGQTRSYTNQLPRDFEFGNGMNWINRQRPALGETDDGLVFVILGFNNVRYFAPAGGDIYTVAFPKIFAASSG